MKRVPDRQQLQVIVFSLLVILSPIVGLMAFSGTAQAAHNQKEPNDFRSEAEPVSGGQITSTELGTASSLTGNVNTDSRDYDEDWFSFSPPESEFVLNVESIPSNEGDIGIEVEDGGGTTVATSNTEADAVQKDYDNDGVTETVTQVSVTGADTSDTYYVKLFAHDDPKNDPNVYAAEACGLNSDGDSSCDGNYELYLSYPPTADATTGDADGNVLEGQTVSFDASGTTDPDDSQSSLSFSWAFGDGSGSGVSPGHSFTTGNDGGTTSYTPEVTVTDSGGGQDTDTTKQITVYNDFDGDGLADVDNPSPSDIDGDTDDDNDGIADSEDPAPYNVYPSASDGTESTDEDSTLTVGNGDSTDLTELATDGYKSYDTNTDPISIEQVDGEPFSAGDPVTLDSGATVTVESDGGWTYDPNGTYENLASGDTATDEFTYTVSDDPHSGTAAATEQGTVSVTTNGNNDVPTAPTDDDSTPNEIAEDDGADTAVGITASSTDIDDGDTVSYSLTADANGGFEIDSSTGNVTIDDSSTIDYEVANSQTITVEASDGTAAVTEDFTIAVTDVDETPAFTSATSNSVAENKTNGAAVHDVNADVDAYGDRAGDTGVTYAIVGGNVDGAFAIDSSTGQVTVDDASGIETEISSERTITVEAAEGSESDTQDVTVDITQVDEVPAFTSGTSASVSEGAIPGNAVDDVEANVGGAADEDVSYTFTSGNGDDAYAIDGGSGRITVSNAARLDYEVSETRTVTVEASEGDATNTQNLSIAVTDAEETPSFSSDTTATVAESDTGGTDVLDVNATVGGDDDEGVGYAITAGNDDVAGNGGGPFTIDSSGQISISDTADINESQQSSFSLTVEADEGAATNTQTVTVTVTDDVAPTFQPDSSTPADSATDHLPSEDLILRFDEGVTLTSGNIELVDDGDGSSSEMLAVSSGSVTVSGRTVTVSPSSPLESETNYHVEIDGTAIEDAFGNSYDGFSDSSIYNVTTANTEPSFTSSGPVSVSADEDGSVDLTGVLEVRDISSSDDLTWTVTNAPSNGGLAGVDNETQSTSGGSSPHVLSAAPTYAPSVDFHDGGSPDDSFTVRVTDTSPGTIETITVDVTVDPVNDRPSISLPTNPNQTIGDNTTAQTVAGFIDTSTFDPGPNEGSQALSDFVVNNDNSGLFATQPDVATNGDLTYTPADNATGTATVDVQVRDDGGTTNGGEDTSTARSFTITVDNEPPSITDFSASNPASQDVAVSFESDERLATIGLSIRGAETATLAGREFTRTGTGDGAYTYQATYNGSSDGEYTATLDAAVDDAGNDAASGQSAAVTVRESDGDGAAFGILSAEADGPVSAGEAVNLEATIENTGTAPGTQTVALLMGGQLDQPGAVVDTESLSLDVGETRTLAFRYTPGETDTSETMLSVRTDDHEMTVSVNIDSGLGRYTDENGVVRITGLRAAVDDWRQGQIETALLRQVINAWQSGEIVT